MEIQFEYGHGFMKADLPDNTDVFVPGETIPDPEHLPTEELEAVTLESIRNPLGMPKLTELAKEGSKVTIIFPDRVKGGEQETSHRKLSIRLILQELYSVGVKKEDILLICSNGLHRRNTEKELLSVLGSELYHAFADSGQIINHDSEDYDHLIDLGTTAQGDQVIMNKYVYDSDVAILIGHTQGNPYGGYSGGYKHCSTGITHWRSIAAHHVPKVMHREDFVPVNNNSLMRHKFDEIGKHMEEKMGKQFFCCDAVLDTKSRQIEINSGTADHVQAKSWVKGNQRTYVPFAEKKYDILVFGMPSSPLAQPWPVLGGSTLSALVGWLCLVLVPDPVLGGALAVGLSVALMVPLRCLHPPGGSMALRAKCTTRQTRRYAPVATGAD